jgi:hypothetical protein
MDATGVGSKVTLQQFITENPGSESLAGVLKAKGMAESEIVQCLQKTKEDWIGGKTGQPWIDPGVGGKDSRDVLNNLNKLNPENIQTDIYSFMAMFLKMSQTMRAAARQDRETSMQAQVNTLTDAANKIKEAADQRFSAAIVQGAFQIGSGLLTAGMGFASMGMMKGAGSLSDRDFNVLSNKVTAMNSVGQGGGGILTGVGTMISAGYEQKAGVMDSDRAKLEAQAKIQEAGRDKANEMMQQMQDIIRDIRDKLSAIEQSSIEANRGIARNI